MASRKVILNLARIAPMVAGLFFAAGAPSQDAQKAAEQPAARSEGAGLWKSPDEVYTKICAQCHDTGVSPTIKGRRLGAQMTMVMVRVGPGAMPAFRKTDIDDAMLKKLGEMIEKSPPPEDADKKADAGTKKPGGTQ